jgi:hypothetical protein
LAVVLDFTTDKKVGPQLPSFGIRSDDVRAVIVTDLHTELGGGLLHFAKIKALMPDTQLTSPKEFVGRIAEPIAEVVCAQFNRDRDHRENALFRMSEDLA